MPKEEQCPERAALAKAVAESISNAYTLKCEYESARTRKEATSQLFAALQAARKATSDAVHAYRVHGKAHGCQ